MIQEWGRMGIKKEQWGKAKEYIYWKEKGIEVETEKDLRQKRKGAKEKI